MTHLADQLFEFSCPLVDDVLLDWDCCLLIQVIVRSVAFRHLARLADVV